MRVIAPRARRSLALALLANAAIGCHFGRHRGEAPVPLRSPARDSLFAADLARSDSAARLGLAAASEGWLADEVVYLCAGAPVVYGRPAALAAIAAVSDSARYVWEPLGGEVARDGRTGYTYGVAASAAPASSGTSLQLARYIAFWRRAGDGRWRIAAYSEVNGASLPAGVQLAASERPRSVVLTGRRAQATADARSTDSAFADLGEREGLATAFSTYAAKMGVLFAGTELVIGPDAVRAFYEAQPGAGTLNWQPILADAAESGDLAMTVGEYVLTGRGPTGAVGQRFGKYLTIWKRQQDGQWRFVVDGGSASPAPAR